MTRAEIIDRLRRLARPERFHEIIQWPTDQLLALLQHYEQQRN